MTESTIEDAQAFIDGNYYKIGFRDRAYVWSDTNGWVLSRKDEDEAITKIKLSITNGWRYGAEAVTIESYAQEIIMRRKKEKQDRDEMKQRMLDRLNK